MSISLRRLALFTVGLLLLGLLLWLVQERRQQSDATAVPAPDIPDFAAIKDVRAKKTTFFQFLLPRVRNANQAIREERSRLQAMLQALDQGGDLTEADTAWLQDLAARYRVPEDPLQAGTARDLLLKRVNTIPASLVLAQAANESAWGTARFAREGNNFFGIWCWSEDCGLVPKARDEDKSHEVTRFESIDAGIRYYLLTLNSHPAYTLLRDIRQKQLEMEQAPTGYDLAAGLLNYSERRQAYVEEIRDMIRHNNLRRFTQVQTDR